MEKKPYIAPRLAWREFEPLCLLVFSNGEEVEIPDDGETDIIDSNRRTHRWWGDYGYYYD